MNNDFEVDKSIDLESLKRQADAMNRARQADYVDDTEETKVIGSDWMNPNRTQKVEPKVEPQEIQYDNKPELIPDETAPDVTMTANTDYKGPGLVVNNNEFTEEVEELKPNYTGVTPSTQEYLDAYLKEMDEDIEMLKEEAELRKEEDDEDSEEESDNMTSDEFNEKYDQAVVIIDKTNFGHIVNFTEEEHEKLEKVNKIKLEEIETVSLNTIKTKKIKKKSDFNKIIKKINNITTTSIVLPISGYVAEMRGCSAYELISLIGNNDNAMLNAQNRWSVIHDKVESTSIGKMDFNEFMLNTASSDYETLIYGILCSTYPDDSSMTITCEKCGKRFEHKYSVRSLIRAEEMSDSLKDAFVTIVDNSISEEAAKAVHNESPIKQVKRVKLPMSGIIAEIYVQSAYDLLNKSIKGLNDNKDSKYNDTAVISTLVNTLYIPDVDEPGSYFEVDEALDIAKTLYSMSEKDIMVIRKIGEDMMKDMTVEYGLMNIHCPYCNHYTPTLPVNVEDILFFRYQKSLNTEIE